MADIKKTDLLLVNRSGKSANASFDMIQASVLAGKLYIGSTPPSNPDDIKDGMLWVDNSDTTNKFYIAEGEGKNVLWQPIDGSGAEFLSELKDVYATDEFEPEDGESLVFFNDVYEGGADKAYPGWKPKAVKGGGIAPKIDVILSEENPNIHKTGTPRFTNQQFNVDIEPKESDDYSYGNYEVQAYVDGTYNLEEIIEGPNATMSGLRFDKPRGTLLSKSNNLSNNSTVSFWVKPTNTGDEWIFNARPSDAADQVGLYDNGSNVISVYSIHTRNRDPSCKKSVVSPCGEFC